MQPERWKQIEKLFIEALDREPSERESFLDQACVGDPWLRDELAALIRSHEAVDSLLDSPRPGEIIGRTIGRYEVLSLTGVGGMGEVYRARDIKLGRNVALKLLPDRFSDEPERVERFEREAKILASLNHPNIAAIYDLEESDGIRCLVLEFVEGESLADRLSRGRIPIKEILDISRQIAEALEAAHEQGVVHRDLKPANVMITPKRVVKVLDFGIARLLEPTPSPESTVSSDSMTAGKVIGTASYMSPEQARGQPVDKRTDIWAFGCVLYELLTGRRAFQGDTLTDTLAAVVEREPDWKAVPGNVPVRVQEILRRCLDKDVRQRLRDIGDARIEIERSGREPTAAGLPGARSLRRRILRIGAAVLVLFIAALAVYRWFTLPSAAPFERMEITRLTDSGKASEAAISADGKFVVHVVTEDGKSSLWIRQAATGSNFQRLPPATGNFYGLKFSRDGNSLYYGFAPKLPGSMYTIPVLGGNPRKLYENKIGSTSGSFSPDEKHLVEARWELPNKSVLVTFNADGSGERQIAARYFPERLYWPAWSPDGKTIAYVVISYRGGFSITLEAIPVEGGRVQRIGSRTWKSFLGAQWMPNGHGLILLASEHASAASLSVNNTAQVWHISYPEGEARQITNDLNSYGAPSLTGDGSALVAVQSETTTHIWVASIGDAGSARQVTRGIQDGTTNPDWTRDGRIIYSAPDRAQTTQLWITATDGSPPQQLTDGDYFNASPSVCGDGRFVFLSYRAGTPHIWRANLDGSGAQQLTNGDSESRPSCSPDGTWLTYAADEPKAAGVWRMPVDGGKPVRIWEQGGISRISPNGKWVLIRDPGGAPKARIIAASGGEPVKTFDPDPEWGLPLQWTADSRGFLYVKTIKGVSNVWQRSLDGGETRQLTNFDSDQINNVLGVEGIALSKDGKRLALERGSTRSDIVMIKDLNAK